MSHPETLRFLRQYFLNPEDSQIQRKISLSAFLNAVYKEYRKKCPSVFSEEQFFSKKEVQGEFENALSRLVTTHSRHWLSLNALAVTTREGGLQSRVCALAQDAVFKWRSAQSASTQGEIMSELAAVKAALDKKKQELDIREANIDEQSKVLEEFAQRMERREEDLKTILKGEYDVMLYSLEEACREKLAAVNKKALAVEKNLRSKIQIITQKAKESKGQEKQAQNVEDRLKSKIMSLEKNNDFLKAKALDAEKRLAEEKGVTALLQSQADAQKAKVLQLEARIRELSRNSNGNGGGGRSQQGGCKKAQFGGGE